MNIRRIRIEDALPARDLRLRALSTDPLAFGSTLARESDRPDEFWIERATRGAGGEDSATFLACEGDTLVGSIVVHRLRGDRFGVFGVWVAPEARQKGVAAQLLAAMEPWAKSHGARQLELLVSDAAESARRLYLRAGFHFDGRIDASPHVGVVEHGMAKALTG